MADRAPLRPGVAPVFSFHIEELILHGFARIDRYEFIPVRASAA